MPEFPAQLPQKRTNAPRDRRFIAIGVSSLVAV